jgi:Tol biopolymer transport system component
MCRSGYLPETLGSCPNLCSGDDKRMRDIFVLDRAAKSITLARVDDNDTAANGDSRRPSISADGRFVVFESQAASLVTGHTSKHRDIFVRDLITGTTRRVSQSTAGAQGNGNSHSAMISADSRCVTFESTAKTLDPAAKRGLPRSTC